MSEFISIYTDWQSQLLQRVQISPAVSLSLCVKWPEHAADHVHSSTAAVKNTWGYTSNLLHTFMACTRTTFTYPFTFWIPV